jgi:hypothetical protein
MTALGNYNLLKSFKTKKVADVADKSDVNVLMASNFNLILILK